MKNRQDLSVLIIEDEQLFRSLAFQIFDGCKRATALNAQDGLNKFKEHCPDITLLDIGLPDKSGLDLLPELLGYDPEAFIVMLTASRISTDVNRAKELGAAGYIVKPFTHAKVASCLQKYNEFKRKLQEIAPEDRANNLIAKLKIEAIEIDLEKEAEEKRQRELEAYKSAIKETIGNWKILFVDDYPTNRERANKQLRNLSPNIHITGKGIEALEMVRKHSFDIIFLDSKLSDINGYKVTEMIREYEIEKNHPRAVIIGMIETKSDEIEKNFWQASGMDDYIAKPTKFIQLREFLEKYADLQVKEREI